MKRRCIGRVLAELCGHWRPAFSSACLPSQVLHAFSPPLAAALLAAGWGLPFCFTAAAGFPRHRLAAIDAACMIHPAREPTGEYLVVARPLKLPTAAWTRVHSALSRSEQPAWQPSSMPAPVCHHHPSDSVSALLTSTAPMYTACPTGNKMSVSERIKKGLIKPGSIYARFAELTPFESPLAEQRAQWKVGGPPAAAAGAMPC